MRDGRCVRIVGLPALLAVAVTAVGPVATQVGDSAAVTSAVQLTATEALIMTGTNMHTVDPGWMQLAIDGFIEPTLGGHYVGVPVQTPEEFWPFGGITDAVIDDSIRAGGALLDLAFDEALARTAAAGDPGAPVVVFGYSQSAAIATNLKRRLGESVAAGEPLPPVSFVVIGNLARPNGGLYARFAGQQLPGWTMSGAMPTDTGLPTIDIARQYDFFADFPLDPSNGLAVANAVMGAIYAHDYQGVTLDPSDPRYHPGTVVQTYGDTTYYFIPTDHLPLLQPLWDLGVSPAELGALEAELRAVVEQGYDRSIPFGEPTPVKPGGPAAGESVPATLAGFDLSPAPTGSVAPPPANPLAGQRPTTTADRPVRPAVRAALRSDTPAATADRSEPRAARARPAKSDAVPADGVAGGSAPRAE